MNRVTLFVSDACNLRCRYCYVVGHGKPSKAMMSEDTARSIARRLFGVHGSCSYVQFFGGEPALNIPAMRVFVSEVHSLIEKGESARPPRFGIVTNGAARQAPDLVSFCAENNVGATVSIDGPRWIHDALRPTANGMGSFDDAVTTVGSLLKAQVPVAIETVYTSAHIDEECSIVTCSCTRRVLA